MDKLTKRTLTRAFEADSTLKNSLYSKDQAIQNFAKEQLALIAEKPLAFIQVHFNSIIRLA